MKPLRWVRSSKVDLCRFPEGARSEAGHALYLAQKGERAINALPMTGFGSSKVLEVVIPEDGDAYRAIYTIKFEDAVYVLHAFQKKSKRGVETPRRDMALIKSRLKLAEGHYAKSTPQKNREKQYDRKKR